MQKLLYGLLSAAWSWIRWGGRRRDAGSRGLRLWNSRWSRHRRRALLDRAWADIGSARNKYQIDEKYEDHQCSSEVDRCLHEEIRCAADAEHRANSTWCSQSACETLALCGLSKYDKSEKDRDEDRENYCDCEHSDAKTLMI